MEDVAEKLPNITSENDLERICAILSPKEPSVDGEFDPPTANEDLIEDYFEFLTKNLTKGLILKGRETLGYFNWEERFIFGVGDKHEYNQFKKEDASISDDLRLISLNEIDDEQGIIAKVRRGDKKMFNIPLADLEVKDQSSSAFNFVDDYGVYITNYLSY